MSTFQAGDVVTIDFPGVRGIKRRPAIIVSSTTYHQHRPDVIVAVVTSQVQKAMAPTDYILQDWSKAGLHRPSAFRSFLTTLPAVAATSIGRCSDQDWQGIQGCLKKAIATSTA